MKQITKLSMFIYIAVCLAACNKELNIYPTTSEVDGNVITDTKSAQTVLNGVYTRFANGRPDYNKAPSIFWSTNNEVLPSELSNLLNFAYGTDGVPSFQFTPASEIGGWGSDYQLVNAANSFLKNIDPINKIPAATKNEMVGEAKFLRAFGNADLLFYYGQYYNSNSTYGIILRNEAVTSANINQPRATVAAVYQSILADIDTSIAVLPSLNTSISYANSWTAKLLKARVLINRGLPGDYAQVISLSDDIIKNGPFALEKNVKDIFWTLGFSSKEVMLGVQPYSTETFKFNLYVANVSYVASPNLQTLLANDPRSQWVDQQLNSPYGGSLQIITKYYSGNVNNLIQTPLSENCYAFRLTEAYLLEAEAITLSSGDLSQAKTLLKTVMSHAGLTDFSAVNNANDAATLQLLVVQEEMKNFVAENGLDWLALRRLPIATIQTMQPALVSINSYILPIPLSEITANSQIKQNPGY